MFCILTEISKNNFSQITFLRSGKLSLLTGNLLLCVKNNISLLAYLNAENAVKLQLFQNKLVSGMEILPWFSYETPACTSLFFEKKLLVVDEGQYCELGLWKEYLWALGGMLALPSKVSVKV